MLACSEFYLLTSFAQVPISVIFVIKVSLFKDFDLM